VELAVENLWTEMTYHAEKRQKKDEDEEEDVISYWITFWTNGYSGN
jgi:hypothetical protein